MSTSTGSKADFVGAAAARLIVTFSHLSDKEAAASAVKRARALADELGLKDEDAPATTAPASKPARER
jgi:hypothetical protein